MNINEMGEIIALIIVGIVYAGIVWNKVNSLKEDLEQHKQVVSNQFADILATHQQLTVTIVNAPTKDDINKLSSEIHGLKISLTKLETILNFMAYKEGIDFENKKQK